MAASRTVIDRRKSTRRERDNKAHVLLVLAIFIGLSFLTACGGGGSSPPVITTPPPVMTTSHPQGVWTTLPYSMPINPVHAILLNTGNVLFVAGSGNCSPTQAGCPTSPAGFTATVWTPNATIAQFKTQSLAFDLFCNGAVQLADGRVLLDGGTASYAGGGAAAIMAAMGMGHKVPGGAVTAAAEGAPGHRPGRRVPFDATTAADQEFLGERRAMIFDTANSTFNITPPMMHGRWYPTDTVMSDGRVAVFGGQDEFANDNSLIEYWTGTQWSAVEPYCTVNGVTDNCSNFLYSDGTTPVPGAPALYPRMILLPDGRLIHVGPESETWIFDPSIANPGVNWNFLASTQSTEMRTYGSAVLLPLTPANNYAARIIIMGGMGSTPVATNTTELLDMSQSNPQWVYGATMSLPRVEMNAVLLPTGKILAVGGSANDEDNSTASLTADLYDPATNLFISAGSNVFPRLYHSTALLLPDATVVLSGGNPQQGVYEPHIEVYQPAYLFNADGSLAVRPSMTGVPATIGYGAGFGVATDADVASVVLVHPGAPTHSFDMGQRFIGLSFTRGSGNDSITVVGPPNGNIAPPGFYMLFLVNKAGVPSIASFVDVQ